MNRNIEIRYGMELTKADQAKIEKFFRSKYDGAVFSYVSEPELIGGFVAVCGDEVYDASVLAKLEKIKTGLL